MASPLRAHGPTGLATLKVQPIAARRAASSTQRKWECMPFTASPCPRPLGDPEPASPHLGFAGRAQSAHESRGNRIRETALGARCLFLDPISPNIDRLIFALLYRNLMAACQIWCERRAAVISHATGPQTSAVSDVRRAVRRSVRLWHGSCVSKLECSDLVRGIEP
jgi:hypothetical protein